MTISRSSSVTSGFGPTRTIVLIGMMGAGKTSVGRRLASRLALPFADADTEVEAAAGMTISQLIKDYGEPEFRRLEKRVMARLLEAPMQVLSTGGGAFMNSDTRALISTKGISVWLKANTEILLERATRYDNRPLLQGGDPREIMTKLLAEREPIYALADITIESDGRPVDETVERLIKALKTYSETKGENLRVGV
jgi:shikimate kinase